MLGGGGITDRDPSAVTGGGTLDRPSAVSGGGIAEHEPSAVTGGGTLDLPSAVSGGGVTTERPSAVSGGGGIAEHDSSAVTGGGGITDPDSAVLGGGGNPAVHAPNSITPWCAPRPIPATPPAPTGASGLATPRLGASRVPLATTSLWITQVSSEVHTTTRVRSPRNRSRANSSGSPDRA
jgi:hypothetical protein